MWHPVYDQMKEEGTKRMKDFKVRCVRNNSIILQKMCRVGDVFQFKNGCTTWNNGEISSAYSDVEDLNKRNIFLGFELIPEPQQFTKADLKTGMRVKFAPKDGLYIIVQVEQIFMAIDCNNNGISLANFTEDLKSKISPGEWDIIKVYNLPYMNCNILDWDCHGELLWLRPEIPKMTHKEIEQALGHEFEYVKE